MSKVKSIKRELSTHHFLLIDHHHFPKHSNQSPNFLPLLSPPLSWSLLRPHNQTRRTYHKFHPAAYGQTFSSVVQTLRNWKEFWTPQLKTTLAKGDRIQTEVSSSSSLPSGHLSTFFSLIRFIEYVTNDRDKMVVKQIWKLSTFLKVTTEICIICIIF